MKQISWKRMAIIGGIAVAAAAALTVLIIFVGIPAAKYARANTLQKQKDYAEAYDGYDRMGDYGNAEALKKKLQEDVFATRTEQTMKFGGREWLVLEERDGKALLLLRDVLELRAYNDELEDSTWESCTLRAYLNGPFYNSFEDADRARIAETAVTNRESAEYGTKGGGDTRDHVFLLSLAEAKLYFPDNAARMARNNGSAVYWWLRSPGLEPILAATVGSDGTLNFAGSGVNYSTRGVRPALWITKE